MRNLALWVLLVLIALLFLIEMSEKRNAREEISYNAFLEQIDARNLRSVTFTDRKVTGEFKSEISLEVNGRTVPVRSFEVLLPTDSPQLPQLIHDKDKTVEIHARAPGSFWPGILLNWLPALLLVVFWLFVLRQMQAGGSTALKFGKSKAKLLIENHPRVTFKDVAGCDEAKVELEEIIEFLKEPQKFQRLGGRIPRGALLLGPPGTGKTLLAKAVAGEAAVPFFSMSGSDFVEMFVGVGASRVRDLFDQGKKNAPCIIFIDEIDAVGRHRGAGLGGGHDEREQTLNQLLVEMDGFDSSEAVILLAATNRPDVLDPALLRPGRFDRQIVVDWPDVRGREGILKVHARNIPLDGDVKLDVLAKGTPGMSGADLANLVNEAALLAARRNKKKVAMRDFEDAKDKVMLGTERKSLVMTDKEKLSTAYHEAGHALVSWLLPGSTPVHKVTVIPRGRALGITSYLPQEERHNESREQLLTHITGLMGGRAAERIVYDQLNTGAARDIEQATSLAHKMVCEWGMSERLGSLTFGRKEEMVFLGREIATQKDYSDRTAEMIDDEVRAIVEGCYQKALDLLKANEERLHLLARTLVEREILDGEQLDRVLKGEPLDGATPGGAEAQAAAPGRPDAAAAEEAKPGVNPLTGKGPKQLDAFA
ncbi:MAG TPA: ATP-dependent zinc metalloprotease FtsH [Candidatus Saccharimonadales bacterium]|nr:ATP-dependent zinc metalloprotease FtsH [Candidatus Saccharimonadales bacterium]